MLEKITLTDVQWAAVQQTADALVAFVLEQTIIDKGDDIGAALFRGERQRKALTRMYSFNSKSQNGSVQRLFKKIGLLDIFRPFEQSNTVRADGYSEIRDRVKNFLHSELSEIFYEDLDPLATINLHLGIAEDGSLDVSLELISQDNYDFQNMLAVYEKQKIVRL